MAKHEEFLRQVKALAELPRLYNDPLAHLANISTSDVLKILAIIEKLREQRNEALEYLAETMHQHKEWCHKANEKLDEIVGQG